MSRTQRHLLSIRDLTYAVAHDNKKVCCRWIGRQGEHGAHGRVGWRWSEARIFLLLEEETTLLDIAKRRVVKTQTNTSHVAYVEVCSSVRNHANSEMPRVTTVSGKVIFVRCAKPYRRKCSLKEDQVVRRMLGWTVAKAILMMKLWKEIIMWVTPLWMHMKSSVNSVNPYVVNVQLGKAKVNCKMQVDTGHLVLQCQSVCMILYYLIIPFCIRK